MPVADRFMCVAVHTCRNGWQLPIQLVQPLSVAQLVENLCVHATCASTSRRVLKCVCVSARVADLVGLIR